MSYVEYKHYFRVNKEKQSITIENDRMFDLAVRGIRSRGYFLVKDEKTPVAHSKFKFYFGVVIGKYCMNSSIFASYTKFGIHKVLFEDLRSREAIINGKVRLVVDKPFEHYADNDIKKYLEELIPHLAVEYNIVIGTKENDYEYKG